MNDGRDELIQYIRNVENSPLHVLRAAIAYFKMNAEDGPEIAAMLSRSLQRKLVQIKRKT